MKKLFFAFSVASLLLFVGCEKDVQKSSFEFNAIAERPTSDDGAKTHLVNEQYVYWDEGDVISLASDFEYGDDVAMATLVRRVGGSEFNGMFQAELSESASKFLALYPYNEGNVINYSGGSFSDVTMMFPKEQRFTTDNTFGVDACPMVAYNVSGEYPFKLLFHNLCGFARIQIFSSIDPKQINSISFTETSTTPKQISGPFSVRNFDNYDPYLVPTDATGGNLSCNIPVSFTVGNGTSGLLTCYLALPALDPASGSNGATTYTITMTVRNTANQQCKKVFSVPIRRNGITMMPALDITMWSESGSGSADASIAGIGTQDRPFKIYTAQELLQVRDAINANSTINSKTITSNTYFKIMRSDIVLNNTDDPFDPNDVAWTQGIRNFQGHFIYGASNSSNPGITNNSNCPLFESITENGVVQGITIKGTMERTTTDVFDFSPLCYTNRGSIIDCVIASDARFSVTSTNASTCGVAGICRDNYGSIQGCGCKGSLFASNHAVAGIVLHNRGSLSACYISSPMMALNGTLYAGGICYENTSNGSISDCYFAANISTSNAHWGGIAYSNAGSITHCFVDHSGILHTDKSVGGIVNVNTAGSIDYCFNQTDLMYGGQAGMTGGGLGGIVNRMSGGEIRNSYCNIPTVSFTLTSGYGGGFVADMSGGAIKNCYSYLDLHNDGGSAVGSFVGRITGGEIVNCYGYEVLDGGRNFYGQGSDEFISHSYVYLASAAKKKGARKDGAITPFDATQDAYQTLALNLNEWVTSNGSPYRAWNQSGFSIPTLSSTAPASKARSHRRK